MPWVKELINIIKKQRKYASFFEWPDKDIKELGVLKELFKSMAKNSACPYKNPKCLKTDPPDCIAEDTEGNLIGFEITELVDEATVRQSQKGYAQPKYWESHELLEHLQQLIREKDQKTFRGGTLQRLVLVIFTDEFNLDPETVRPLVKNNTFQKTLQINAVYFLFSYDPRIHQYPYAQLNLPPN